MKLSIFSDHKLKSTFNSCYVQDEYRDPLYNYLVFGCEPGGFWTSALANNFFDAMMRSHPSNDVTALKDVCTWIYNYMPKCAYGSYEAVRHWAKLSTSARREILEQHELIYTEKEETWLAISQDHNEYMD